MGAASRKLFPKDGGSAASTWMPGPSIDPCLASVVSIHPFKIAEITEGGAPGSDADLKHGHESLSKRLQLPHFETASRSEGLDACAEEAFIGVNVADSGNKCLVEKCGLDRSAAPLESLFQIGAGENRTEGFRAKAAEPRDHLFRRAAGWDPPHLSETANVNEAKFLFG